jgi:hypothetical protein
VAPSAKWRSINDASARVAHALESDQDALVTWGAKALVKTDFLVLSLSLVSKKNLV